jgi:predicted nucleic acid-binding protein
MRNDRAFVDTSVLVYAIDRGSPGKRARARAVLADLGAAIVISTQVLLEFYVTVSRKLAASISPDEAQRRVTELSRLDVVSVTPLLVQAAVALAREHRLSVWDALVIESARARRCSRVLSEDLQNGRDFGDVRIENPFTDL